MKKEIIKEILVQLHNQYMKSYSEAYVLGRFEFAEMCKVKAVTVCEVWAVLSGQEIINAINDIFDS